MVDQRSDIAQKFFCDPPSELFINNKKLSIFQMMDQRSEIAEEVFSDPPSELTFSKQIIINVPDYGSKIRDC